MSHNMVGWFEIPVTDMERAKAFYNGLFNVEIQVQGFGGSLMGFFPFFEDKLGASGALIQHESYIPSETQGILVYFSSSDVNIELSREEAAGGKIVRQKSLISPDIGYMAIVIDCEGNRIAIHSRK